MILLRALRVHQWTKNGLLLAPLIASHRVWPLDWVPAALVAFISLSLVASGTYLVNDLLDVEADRVHPTKRLRPIAAGALAPRSALAIACGLTVLGALLAVLLGRDFALMLAGYFALTLLYSLWLKRVALLDVIVLAMLYTLRVMAGHVLFEIPISEWMIGFTVFIFMGLALLKRYGELLLAREGPGELLSRGRRGYTERDVELVAYLGVSSSLVSVLVFALYINSSQVRELYRYPDLLWLAVPVLMYWLARVWRIAHNGQMDADPVVFALKDGTSYVAGVLLLAIVVLAAGIG